MEAFGIKFAPLKVPLQRRLQTLAIASWIATFVIVFFASPVVALYLIVFTRYWWLTVLYLCWIFLIDKNISEKGGRQSKWARSWLWWKYVRDYFPLKFERLPGVVLDPKKNYLFCCFPHGILSIGACSAFGSEWSEFGKYFPHHTPHMATMSLHYVLPFMRELYLALGGISCSAKSISYVLGDPEGGHACVLIVGGRPEAHFGQPGNYKLVLKRRKGFIKLALKNGTPLVPVISFGELDFYNLVECPNCIKDALSKWFHNVPRLLMGRGFFQYSFGLLPHRRRVTTLVGVPIDVPKIHDPTSDQVDQYHEEFTKKLIELFEEQKYNYLENPEDKHLTIV